MNIYALGWPTNPFKQLTPQAMAALLRRINAAQPKPVLEDAPW